MNRIIIIIIIIILFCFANNYAQIKITSKPYSNDRFLKISSLELSYTELNVERKGHSVIKKNDTNRIQLTESLPFKCNILKAGIKNALDSNEICYSIKIKAEGAFFLTCTFLELSLSKNQDLFIYNKNKTVLVHISNRTKFKKAIPSFIPGDEIFLTFKTNERDMDKSKVIINRIEYGIVDYYEIQKNLKTHTKSSSISDCAINAACEPKWEKQADASVRLAEYTGYGWSIFGSATLINNTAENNRKYLLTALHNLTLGVDISSWVFNFFGRFRDCEGTISHDNYFTTGAIEIARNDDTDML